MLWRKQKEQWKKSQEDNLSVRPVMTKTPLFMRSVFVLCQSKAVYFKPFHFCLEGCYFLEARGDTRLKHMNNFTHLNSRLSNQ